MVIVRPLVMTAENPACRWRKLWFLLWLVDV